MTVETTRGDGVIRKPSCQTGKQPTKPKSKTKKLSNAYCRIKGASCYFIIDTSIVQLPNHDWTQPGSLLTKVSPSFSAHLAHKVWPVKGSLQSKKFSVGRLHITPGPNSDRHNLINQPAAPCLLNKNERCPKRRTIYIWALPAEAAPAAGISVLMQPTPASCFVLFFSPSLRWNQSQTKKRKLQWEAFIVNNVGAL